MIFIPFIAFSIFLSLVVLPDRDIDPLVKPYVEEYIEDANRHGFNLSLDDIRYVGFEDIELISDGRRVAGVGYNQMVFISVDMRYYFELMFHRRAAKELVYHELTHALFNCPHQKSGIMMSNEWIIDNGEDIDDYVEQLFTVDVKSYGCEWSKFRR